MLDLYLTVYQEQQTQAWSHLIKLILVKLHIFHQWGRSGPRVTSGFQRVNVHQKSTVHLRRSTQLDVVCLLDTTSIGGHIWFYPMGVLKLYWPEALYSTKGWSYKQFLGFVHGARTTHIVRIETSRLQVLYVTYMGWKKKIFLSKIGTLGFQQ